MKKRQFLAPLALSLAALLNTTAVEAGTTNTSIETQPALSSTAVSGLPAQLNDFILKPSHNSARLEQFAYHESHSSHVSHASHRSHYSSR